LMRQLGHKCHKVDQQDDSVSVADSLCENHSVGHDSHSSEISWEAVDEKDTRPQLWLPDYAVTRCFRCDAAFWLGKRKHHCRSCGKIFCADCTDHQITIPSEQFYDPVRVCNSCYYRQLNNQGRLQETRPTNGLHHQGSPETTTSTASPSNGIIHHNKLSSGEEHSRSHHNNSTSSKPNSEVTLSTTAPTSNGISKPKSSKNILNGVYPTVHNNFNNGDCVSTNGHSCHQ